MRYLWIVAAAVLAGSSVSAGPAGQTPSNGRDQTLARFFTPTTPPLVSYRAFRRLSASTRGGKMAASIEAWTSLDPATGFTFSVTAEEGSPLIRRRVLLAALEAEQKAVHDGGGRTAALTLENYEFLNVTDDPSELLRIDVRPRRKHMTLIDGALFVKPDTAQLVRVEGELSERPSFWTRRVRIVRNYAEIDGVHVPIAMRSTADVLIVGASTFEMTYDYAEINHQTVPGSSATPH